jgi:hypothetical protein
VRWGSEEETDYGKNCRRRHKIHKGTERMGGRLSPLVKSSNTWRRNSGVWTVSVNPTFLGSSQMLILCAMFERFLVQNSRS